MCDYDIEAELLKKKYSRICGVDEVGRGALSGPVVAGAVILDPKKLNFEIRDSKKLTHRKRVELAKYIYRFALDFSIGWCWNDEIDEMNILAATRWAMKSAVNNLKIIPDYVLMDGMEPDFLEIEGKGILRGDDIALSIAAASIIAKVFRDELMVLLSRYFPQYGYDRNKGYATGQHIQAVKTAGRSIYHRYSFQVV